MPARKPTALKRQAGTLQRCRTNPNEPEPALAMPLPPDHLSDRARLRFEQVSEVLYDMGVLTLADRSAVEGLSQAYCDWRDAIEFLDRNGRNYVVISRAPDGTTREKLKPYPEAAMASNADKRLRAWMQSCGLTPADRQKISRLDPGTEDGFFDDL